MKMRMDERREDGEETLLILRKQHDPEACPGTLFEFHVFPIISGTNKATVKGATVASPIIQAAFAQRIVMDLIEFAQRQKVLKVFFFYGIPCLSPSSGSYSFSVALSKFHAK